MAGDRSGDGDGVGYIMPRHLKNSLIEQAQERDIALARLEAARPIILAAARAIAISIDLEYGEVSSPMVLARIRREGWGEVLDKFDRRLMGAVFGRRRGWRLLRQSTSAPHVASHHRPASVWTRSRKVYM